MALESAGDRRMWKAPRRVAARPRLIPAPVRRDRAARRLIKPRRRRMRPTGRRFPSAECRIRSGGAHEDAPHASKRPSQGRERLAESRDSGGCRRLSHRCRRDSSPRGRKAATARRVPVGRPRERSTGRQKPLGLWLIPSPDRLIALALRRIPSSGPRGSMTTHRVGLRLRAKAVPGRLNPREDNTLRLAIGLIALDRGPIHAGATREDLAFPANPNDPFHIRAPRNGFPGGPQRMPSRIGTIDGSVATILDRTARFAVSRGLYTKAYLQYDGSIASKAQPLARPQFLSNSPSQAA